MKEADVDKDELLDTAADNTRKVLMTLGEWRKQADREDPMGRHVSIAITHLEDALLRLINGPV